VNYWNLSSDSWQLKTGGTVLAQNASGSPEGTKGVISTRFYNVSSTNTMWLTYYGDTLILNSSFSALGTNDGNVGIHTYGTDSNKYADDFRVRKFTYPEPAHASWSAEQSRPSEGETSVSVYPSAVAAVLGAEYTFYITVGNVTDFYAWEFQLSYNQSILDLTFTSIVSGGLNTPTQTFYSLVDEVNGHLWWAVSTVFPETSGITYAEHAIFELRFQMLAIGTSDLGLYNTVLSDSYGVEISHIINNASIIVNAFPLDLIATDINVVNNDCSIYSNDTYSNGTARYCPVEATINNTGVWFASEFYVKLEVYWVDELLPEASQEIQVSGYSGGAFRILSFASLFHPMHTGLYRLVVTVDSRNEIAETVETNNILELLNVPVTITGDVNCDGVVDVFDGTTVALAWNTIPVDPSWNIRADINYDGAVTTSDAARLRLNWNETV